MYDRTTWRPGDSFDVILRWPHLWNIVLPKEVKRKDRKISMDTLISSPAGGGGVLPQFSLSGRYLSMGKARLRKERGDKVVQNSCFEFCMSGRDQ